MGGAFSLLDTYYLPDGFFMVGANAPASQDLTAGDWVTFDLTNVGTAAGDFININILDGSLNLVSNTPIEVIPEPMTMALLGLGGLFLRRRK